MSLNIFLAFSTFGFTVNQMPPTYKTVIALMQTLSTNTVIYCCTLEIQQNAMIKLNKILGWPKNSFGFFRNSLWKNLNELFGQPNINQWFSKCGQWTPGNLLGQIYFYSINAFFACFTVLTFALTVPNQWWVKLLVS